MLHTGSDCVGHVANEVETEQLFIRSTSNPGDCPRVSSVIQCRGSIPLFWSHTNLYNPKPDVQLEDSGMGSEQSAKIHFQKLFSRYGSVRCAFLTAPHLTRPSMQSHVQPSGVFS